jgi:hypothetical protein
MYIIWRVDRVNAVKRARAAVWVAFFVIAGCLHSPARDAPRAPGPPAEPGDAPVAEALKQIYLEVKELGPYPGESVIRHDFFLGPADDDSYKKEHIVVLIQVVDGVERMRIQVTEMKTRPDNPRIQHAGKVRTITCSIATDGHLTMLRADYSEEEIARVVPDILRAVREKKKLLEEYGAKAPKSF